MKLYMHTLCKKGKDVTLEKNRAFVIGFYRSRINAKKSALKMYPGYVSKWWSEMSIFECIYLLPFIPDTKQKREIRE